MKFLEKYRKDLIYIGIIILILLLAFQCNVSKPETIKTPEVKGTFHDTVTLVKLIPKEKIVVKTIPYKVVKDSTIYIHGRTITLQPIDTLQTYSFNKNYEDTHVKITASGVVTGVVNDLKIDYTIKPYEMKVPQTRFRVLLGGELRMSREIGQPNLEAGLMLQNKKGNILKIGYDTDKYFSAGYYVNLFERTK